MTSTIYRSLAIVCWIIFPAVVFAQSTPIPADQLEFFEARIRPLLIEHCYECHNSANNAEGGLAVDSRDAFLAGGDGGRILVPGDAKASRLIAILKHEVEGLEMPEGGARLDDQVIGDVEKWIRMGAPDPRDQPPSPDEMESLTSWEATLNRRKLWWSFQPIEARDPPSGQATHPIDRFIDAQLIKAGLQRAPRAAAKTLIRRLFITLIGLPPTEEQLAEWSLRFDDDPQQAAIDLADHLLASPHFGERWARHWMDWIRYAESHGSEGDPAIDNAWYYRDYMIRAWNDDVPYSQLIREHVAGDLLPNPRLNQSLGINESAIGTAHWRMVFHGFAPTDALDEKVRFVDDQINAFSKAFLGLTISCARCHDHKFDAISQADYYALFGILGSCRPAREVIDLPQRQTLHQETLTRLKPGIKAAVIARWQTVGLEQLAQRLKRAELPSVKEPRQDAFIGLLVNVKDADAGAIQSEWTRWVETCSKSASVSQTALSPGAAHWKLSRESDLNQWYTEGIGLHSSPSPAGEFAVATSGEQVLQGIYPSGIYSNTLSSKHPARLTSPDHLIQPDQQLWARVIGDEEASLRYVIQDYPRNGTVFPVQTLHPEWSWKRFDLSYWEGDSMHVEFAAAKDAPLLVNNRERSWFGVTDVMVTSHGISPPERHEALSAVLTAGGQPSSYNEVVELYLAAISAAIDAWAEDALSDDQAHLLDRCVRLGWLPNQVEQLPEVKPLLERYRKLEQEIPVPTRVPGLDETVGRTQPLFVRGNHKRPGELVPRRFLEAFDPSPYETVESGRSQLAEDLVSTDNPLTRRVIVNRLWHHLFGRGIVETTDNLGQLGTKPTHPELLDWLAVRFEQDGWSLKQMIRLMVSSQTWQQSSLPTDAARERDPANQLLSHANVRRMEAEVIRDSLLAVSGRLETNAMFGPPADGRSNRRSIYVRVIRNALDPFLRAFDFPEPFSAVGRRDVTNVPAQSLTMMNSEYVRQIASDLARTVGRGEETESDSQRVNRLFLKLFSRLPTESERAIYLRHLRATRERFSDRTRRRGELELELARQRNLAHSIFEPVRQQLSQISQKQDEAKPLPPQPIAHWSFDEDLNDELGKLHGVGHGAARIEGGALVVRDGGFVTTAPLKHALSAKTLEAWVRLDSLQQRGGGVMTIQTQDGAVFDSIVFGEQSPGHWLAGSDHFRRTQPFQGIADSEADDRFVHIAIVYHGDGRIVGYRDGVPYGSPYSSHGPNRFEPDASIVSFGIRHLPAGGNRLLSARIDQARLYDRALSDTEIAASFSSASGRVTREQVIASMTGQQRNELQTIEQTIKALETEINALGDVPGGSAELAAWIDVAHASLMMKEFIYVP